MWIDSHCHLDAPEFDADRDAVVRRAREAGVGMLVLPAVEPANFDAVRQLAHRHGLAYALGIHPLCVGRAVEADLERLQQALQNHAADPRLVAVGEIGIDHFVSATEADDPLEPALESALEPTLPGAQQQAARRAQAADWQRQERFYLAQLQLARQAGLPVILHVRRSADALLKGLRRVAVTGGIAHAFNGSPVQAQLFVEHGFALGFGGAMTFDRALRIRALAAGLPATVPVLETDAPDIPPHWLYRTAAERAAGHFARNEPAELPRIAATLAGLRGLSLEEIAAMSAANIRRVLPRLARLLDGGAVPAALTNE